MPPRQSEQCTCTVESGCLIMRHTEKSDGSIFMRIMVRGHAARHARSVLTTILHQHAPRFHRKYPPLSDSGTVWRLVGGWCALLCGRELRPARAMAAWTQPDLSRLREVYDAEGMAGCPESFHTGAIRDSPAHSSGTN
jgi:hypothetical protein